MTVNKKADIAMIGGSGLEHIEGMKVLETLDIDTPFGKPSDRITIAEYSGRRVAFLPRHGQYLRKRKKSLAKWLTIPRLIVACGRRAWALCQR